MPFISKFLCKSACIKMGPPFTVFMDKPAIGKLWPQFVIKGWELDAQKGRLDFVQTAVLGVKLPYLANDTARRRSIADHYRKSIENQHLSPPPQVEGTLHAMHLFVLESENRESFRNFLKDAGVGTAIHYPMPIHKQPAYLGRIRGCDHLACTESLYKRIVSLPMYPELTDRQVEKICTTKG